MNIQYAEHLDHVAGCASENNHCLSEARILVDDGVPF